jgi:hypothetical protein
MNFRVPSTGGNSFAAAQLATSQEGLSSMELVATPVEISTERSNQFISNYGFHQ